MRKSLMILCGWLCFGFFLAWNPSESATAPPLENDLLLATGRQAWHQAPLPKTDFSVAQLPQRPAFKSDKQKETPAEVPHSPATEKSRSQPTPSTTPKTSGSLVDVRTYGFTRPALEKAVAVVAKEGGCLYFSSGNWDIDADLTIPDRATVKIDHGALFNVGTQKVSGTISYADESCPGTISVADGSTQVTGTNTEFTKLRSGQSITCAGQRREIRHLADNTHLEVLTPFHPAITGKDFAKSTYIIKGSGTKFDTELEVGDFLYHDQEKHIITSISGPDTLTVEEPPKNTFSGESFTRSVRVKIQGSLETGLYQIFAGKGVVKFAVTSVHPEWWGARANNANNMATANSNAIEKAIHCGPVEFATGTYKINRPIVLPPGSYLSGQGMGWGGTLITLVNGANCHMVQDSPRIRYFPGGLKDIMFNNGVQDAGYDGIHFVNNTKLWQIEHCSFLSNTKHPGGYSIYLNPAAQTWIRENFIMGFFNGIFAYGFDSYYLNNEIMPVGDYAIYMIGDGNVVHGNILYGDSGCKTGIFTKTSNITSIIGNRIGPFDNGIIIFNYGGIIDGNVIHENRVNGIYSDYNVGDAIITNNKLINNKGYGILITGKCFGSLIKNNHFRNNNGGGSNPQIKIDPPVNPNQDSGELLVEDNVGVDLQCDYPILASSNTPAIREARRWKTANTNPTTITDFAGGCRGKEILVVFGDAQTTLKFSGPSRLKGHGGLDWRPAAGDHLRAMKGDDGYWYCESYSSGH